MSDTYAAVRDFLLATAPPLHVLSGDADVMQGAFNSLHVNSTCRRASSLALPDASEVVDDALTLGEQPGRPLCLRCTGAAPAWNMHLADARRVMTLLHRQRESGLPLHARLSADPRWLDVDPAAPTCCTHTGAATDARRTLLDLLRAHRHAVLKELAADAGTPDTWVGVSTLALRQDANHPASPLQALGVFHPWASTNGGFNDIAIFHIPSALLPRLTADQAGVLEGPAPSPQLWPVLLTLIETTLEYGSNTDEIVRALPDLYTSARAILEPAHT